MLAPTAYVQGSLDGLCGLYSIVNAVMLMGGSQIDANRLFAVLTRDLGLNLARMITEGIHLTPYIGLLRSANRFLRAQQNVRLRFQRAARSTRLRHHWETLQAHQARHGAGSVVFALHGRLHHWTCLERVSDKALYVCDSGPAQRFRFDRSRITLHAATKTRIYTVSPNETFLLELV